MTDWTDDELGALLTDTFHSHEGLVHLDAAVRLSERTSVRRRRRPVALAAASVAVLITGTITGTAYVMSRPAQAPAGGGGPVSKPTTTPAAHVRTDAENLRAAAQESERILQLAPLPPGAQRLSGKPEGWPPDAGFGMSPSNSSLTRTAWYAVPLSADDVQDFLLSHHPRGMAAEEGEGVGSTSGVRTYDYVTPRPRQPAAYTDPALLVQWYDLGPRTVIRFDSVIASRRARTPRSYLTGMVTSVAIDRTVQDHTGHGSTRELPTVHLSATHDPEGLEGLVASLNAVYGAVVSNSLHSCPAQTKTTTYRLAFHTTRGDVTYRWDDGCDAVVLVMRGQRRIAPPLDPGGLSSSVSRILTGAPRDQ